MEHEKIVKMLFRVVDEINEMLPPEAQLEKDLEAALAGGKGKLDSAGLINLIVATEEKAAAELNLPIILTDDQTMSQIDRVFGTLGTLANHISALSNETIDR
jgi:acyl carrier protein